MQAKHNAKCHSTGCFLKSVRCVFLDVWPRSSATSVIGNVTRLGELERFVFVMSVLVRYSDCECAMLLNRTIRDISDARLLALRTIGEFSTRWSKTSPCCARGGGSFVPTAANEHHENAVRIHSFSRMPLGSTCARANGDVDSSRVDPGVGCGGADCRSDWRLHRSEQFDRSILCKLLSGVTGSRTNCSDRHSYVSVDARSIAAKRLECRATLIHSSKT